MIAQMFPPPTRTAAVWRGAAAFLLLFVMASAAAAHGVADSDKQFLEQSTGPQIGAFLYLGAKHMMTKIKQNYQGYTAFKQMCVAREWRAICLRHWTRWFSS